MECKTKLFVFSKIFNYPESLNSEEKSDDEDISDTELVEWHKFWIQYGDKIVNSSWISLYSEYLIPDYKNLHENIKHLNLKEEYIHEKLDASEDNINNISESDWQTLWDKHYQYEYSHYFDLFSQNFYNANVNFNFNQELSSEEQNISEEDFTIIDNSNELKAFGLPTAFASSTNYCKFRKRNFKNLSEHLFEESDTEEEEEEDTMDEEQNDIFNISEIENNYNDELQNGITNILASTLENNESIKPPRKRKTKKRPLRKIPLEIREDKSLIKYWRKRFQLFSRFDEGIQLDKESWFSVTPEQIAINISDRMSHCDIVIDGFCGSGGNCIQLAMKCKKVIAIDIDPIKIEMAKHNAKIYGVENNIEFIVGDFLKLCDNLKADGIILSTPWGGPKYNKHSIYDIEKFLQPIPATELMERCSKITENIALYIPKNSDKKQIIKLAGVGKQVEIEQNYVGERLVALTCYYGNLVNNNKQ